MEPKFNSSAENLSFPPEPRFSTREQPAVEIPRIVPAELQTAVIPSAPSEVPSIVPGVSKETPQASVQTEEAEIVTPLEIKQTPLEEESVPSLDDIYVPSVVNSGAPIEPLHENPTQQQAQGTLPQDLLAQLSKEINDLSKPLDATSPELSLEPTTTEKQHSEPFELLPIETPQEQEPQSNEPLQPVTDGTEAEAPVVASLPGESLQTQIPQQETLPPASDEPEPLKGTEPVLVDKPYVAVPVREDSVKDLPAERREIVYPDVGELEEPETSSLFPPILRSIFLLLCLCAVVASIWQVGLFLQPSFMQKEPFSTLAQHSCKIMYCPPYRPLRILQSEMRATSPERWVINLQVQNLDMRQQPLPNVQLDIENVNRSTYQKVFNPSQYTTAPLEKHIRGGSSMNITIYFDYLDGRPSTFSLKLLEP